MVSPYPHVLVPDISEEVSFQTGQCDCACEMAGSAVPVRQHTGRLIAAPETRVMALDSSAWLLFSPPAGRLAVVNRAGLDLWQHFTQPRPTWPRPDEATGTALNRLYAGGLLEPWPDIPVNEPEPDTLAAWLHLSSACQLQCRYCYLAKSGARLDLPTGEAAITAIFRSALRHGFRRVKLKYAGGEPTLNFGLALELHDLARQLADRHDLGLEAVLLSNGQSWTEPMVKAVAGRGIGVMISLDGLASSHDRLRGRGAFAAAIRTVERLQAAQVMPGISVTITALNLAGLPEWVAWLLHRHLPFSLNFYRRPAGRTGPDPLEVEPATLIAGLRSVYHEIETHFPRPCLLGSLLDRAFPGRPHRRACAAGRSYLVIDPAGRIAPCQMTLDQAVTDVTDADPLAALQANRTGIQNISVDERDGCRLCPWRYSCAGGCPAETYRLAGRYNVPSPYCGVYQELLPDVLRLEGLRLLQAENWSISASSSSRAL